MTTCFLRQIPLSILPLLLLAACTADERATRGDRDDSEDSADTASDSGGPGDTGTEDTGTSDTGGSGDTGTEDTGTGDADGSGDAGTEDTGAGDTGGSGDTGDPGDTTAGDTEEPGDTSPPPDRDGDGVVDPVDNCLDVANPGQADLDADGLGDDCDTDADGDGTPFRTDCNDRNAAVTVPVTFYADPDADGFGDPEVSVSVCPDRQPSRTVVDNTDNCPVAPNPAQADADADGIGDACDSDRDGDGFSGTDCDDLDSSVGEPSTYYSDADSDGFGDPDTTRRLCPGAATADLVRLGGDNCPVDPNPGQADLDRDGLGDVCDDDADGDGSPAGADCNDLDARLTAGTLWYRDLDGDGLGDPAQAVASCEPVAGYVLNADDTEPGCPTNDTDACGVCGGTNADADCHGDCFGTAAIDACGRCAGGNTGLVPSGTDGSDSDSDGIPDACDACVTSSSPRFIISYTGVPHYLSGGVSAESVTFEIVLHPDGRIETMYASLPANPDGLAGLQAAGTLNAAVYSAGRPSALTAPSAVSYTPRIDALGYDISSSDDPTGPTFAWTDITTSGDAVALGDDTGTTVPLPFEFPFWGVTYTSVSISSNGYLSFGGSATSYNPAPMPNGVGPVIAGYWRDLEPPDGGEIRYYFSDTVCQPDCNGVIGGPAFVDDCGVCTGGDTGLTPNADKDCAGVCSGDAYYDICGLCVGGTTGREPSPVGSDCVPQPDLWVVESELKSNVYIQYLDASSAYNQCFVAEGCLADIGDRTTHKLLRFSTMIANTGTADFYLGSPPASPPAPDGSRWTWGSCHGHWHFGGYAYYELTDPETGSQVVEGNKNGFCVLDLRIFDRTIAERDFGTYTCSNQGISVGWADIYSAGLDCQWIDVTDVPDGVYEVRVTTNPDCSLAELNCDNNTGKMRVRIAGDSVSVLP